MESPGLCSVSPWKVYVQVNYKLKQFNRTDQKALPEGTEGQAKLPGRVGLCSEGESRFQPDGHQLHRTIFGTTRTS